MRKHLSQSRDPKKAVNNTEELLVTDHTSSRWQAHSFAERGREKGKNQELLEQLCSKNLFSLAQILTGKFQIAGKSILYKIDLRTS